MSTFRLPDLGEGLAEAEIVEWHVKVGDHVRVDQPMVSVETAKAVVEVPAPYSGVVTALRGVPGDIVPTGAPLIEFDAGTVVGTMPETSEEEFVEAATVGGARGPVTHGPRAVPAARAIAKRLGVDLAKVQASGRAGVVTLDDVLRHANISPANAASTPNSERAANGTSTPNSERAANGTSTPNGEPAANGASASNGERAANGTSVSPAARAMAAAGPDAGTVEPLRGIRRAMAQSMSMSRDQVAGSTVCDDADIHGWTRRGDYMLRLMRAMVSAWHVEPALNAWYDSASQSRFLVAHIDLAIAVDTPGGLIVPVVRNIEKKSPEELRAAIASQKEAAHRRSTPAEDLRDFTLMLSNFGTLAGRYGIPLVVPPAVAILGAGKVREDAVVVAGAVQAHRRMPLSLSFDHRCITGGEACRFLASVITDLEKPD